MSENITDLSVFHEVPWENIDGAYVKVHQKIDSTPHMPRKERLETREGQIVGREIGQSLYYDSQRGESAPTYQAAIYLETPEDTILEIRTDKPGNELIEFKPNGDTDE